MKKYLFFLTVIALLYGSIVYALTSSDYDNKGKGSTNDNTQSVLQLENLAGDSVASFLNNGYMGIGQILPTRKLTIHGTSSDANTSILIGSNDANSVELYREYSTGRYKFKINESGGSLDFVGKSDRTDDYFTFSDANVGIGNNSPSSALYVVGNVSADSYTDRTPYYSGDALTEISNIKGDELGMLDHNSLPQFVKKTVTIEQYEENSSTTKNIILQEERDLGAMISVLTRAVQQLNEKCR